MPILGAYFSKPEQPPPYVLGGARRVCRLTQGGIVALYDGTPAVSRKENSPFLGLDWRSLFNLTGINDYLQREIFLAEENDTERRVGAGRILDEIKNDCWKWYAEKESWDCIPFSVDAKFSAQEVKADIKKGQEAISRIYPEFVQRLNLSKK